MSTPHPDASDKAAAGSEDSPRRSDRNRSDENHDERKPPEKASAKGGNSSNSGKKGGMSFSRFAQTLSQWSGRPLTFGLACVLLVGWALSGPFFHYNDTWQLVINTSTTIITFLMVFLIQSTQNRDTDALHIKIDELLRTTRRAHDVLMGLDEMDSEELQKLRKTYEKMGEECAEDDSPQEVAQREQQAPAEQPDDSPRKADS